MGQKIHPTAARLGINTTWSNFWSGDDKTYRNFTELYLAIDKLWKKYVDENLSEDINVQINMREIIIFVNTHKPNIIIGQKGANINKIQSQLQKGLEKLVPNFKKMKLNINLKIKDTAPETSAQIINSQINDALVAKKDYKRVVRALAKLAQEKGALGMRTRVKGRINGKAIASSTQLKFGSIPLHTLSVKVQKHVRHVYTKSGRIGISTVLALASN